MNETIAWQRADGSYPLELAGTDDAVSGFAVVGAASVQVAAGVRRQTAKPIGRGNVATRVSFIVVYAEVASPEAAKEAIAARTAALQGDMLNRKLLEGVFGEITWQLADATLETFELSFAGVSITGRYAFVGGTYTDES